jgi:hypothetical protein
MQSTEGGQFLQRASLEGLVDDSGTFSSLLKASNLVLIHSTKKKK